MIEYIYEGVINEPNIETGYTEPSTGEYHMTSGIHFDVPLSDMTNKNIQYCMWEQGKALLHVYWDAELTSEDKSKLDVIVANNIPEGE